MSEERGPKYLAKCNISVLGLSGTLGIGIGKSALCSRFTHPQADFYERHGEDHSSIISTADFREPEINGEHYAFFGRMSLPYPNAETELRVSVVEHTTFIDDAIMAPFRVGKPYAQRAMAEKLKSSGRVQYECRSMIGGGGGGGGGDAPDSDRALKFTDEFQKRGVDGYVFVMDPTAQAEQRQAQLDLLADCARRVPKRKQLVVVLAKCDALPVDVQDRLRDGFSVPSYFGGGGGSCAGAGGEASASSKQSSKQAKHAAGGGGQLADLPVFFSSARHKVCVDDAFCYVAHITQNLTGLVRRPAPFLPAYEARRQRVNQLRDAAVEFLRQSEAVQPTDDWGAKKQQLLAVDCFRALLLEAGVCACSEVFRMRLVELRLVLNGHAYRVMAKESTASLTPGDLITLVPEVRRDVCNHLDLRMYMHRADDFQAALLSHKVVVPKMEDVFGGKPRLVRLGTVPMQLRAGEGVAAGASGGAQPAVSRLESPQQAAAAAVQAAAPLLLPQPAKVKSPPPTSPSKSVVADDDDDDDADAPPVPIKRYTPDVGAGGSAADARPAALSPSKTMGGEDHNGDDDDDDDDAPPVPVKCYTPDAGRKGSAADPRPAAVSPIKAAPPPPARDLEDENLYDTVRESPASFRAPPASRSAASGSFSAAARLAGGGGGGGLESKSSDPVWGCVPVEQLQLAREKRPPPASQSPAAAQSPVRRPQREAVYADVRDLDVAAAGGAAASPLRSASMSSPLRSASMSPTSTTSSSNSSARCSAGVPLAGSSDYDEVVIIKPYTSSLPVRPPSHSLGGGGGSGGGGVGAAAGAAAGGGSFLDAEPLYDAVGQCDDRKPPAPAQAPPPEGLVDVLYDVVHQEDVERILNGDDAPDFLPPPLDLDPDPEGEDFPEPSADLPPPPMELMDDGDEPEMDPPDEWAPPPPECLAYSQPLDLEVEAMPAPPPPEAERRPLQAPAPARPPPETERRPLQAPAPARPPPDSLPANYEDVTMAATLTLSPTGEHGVVRRSSEVKPPAAKPQPKRSVPGAGAPRPPAAQSYEDADMLRPTPLFAAKLAREASRDGEPAPRPGYEMPPEFKTDRQPPPAAAAGMPAAGSAPAVRPGYDDPVQFKVNQQSASGPAPVAAQAARPAYDMPVEFKVNQQASGPASAPGAGDRRDYDMPIDLMAKQQAPTSTSAVVAEYEMPVDLSASTGEAASARRADYSDANFVRPTGLFALKLAQDAQRAAATAPLEAASVPDGYEAPLSYGADGGDVRPYGTTSAAGTSLYDSPLDELGISGGGGGGAASSSSGGGDKKMKSQLDSTSSLALDMAYLEAMLENSATFGALLGMSSGAETLETLEERPYDCVPLTNIAPPDERAPIPPPTAPDERAPIPPPPAASTSGHRPFHLLSKSLHNDDARPKAEVEARSASTMPSAGAERQRPRPPARQGSEDRPSIPPPATKARAPARAGGGGDVPTSNHSVKNNSSGGRPAAAKKIVPTVSNNTVEEENASSSSSPAKPAPYRGKSPVKQPPQPTPKPGPKPAAKPAPQPAAQQGSQGGSSAGRVGSSWWETPPASPATPQRSDTAASAQTNGSANVTPASSTPHPALRRKSSYENIGQAALGRSAPSAVDPPGALPSSGRGRRAPLNTSASIDEQRVASPQTGDVVVTASRPPVMRKRTASSSSQQRP